MAATAQQYGAQQGSTALSAAAEGADQSGSSNAGSALNTSADQSFGGDELSGICSEGAQTGARCRHCTANEMGSVPTGEAGSN